MSSEDFDPKIGWDSDEDDILNEFYKPALQNCKSYQRLAGYFSSTIFAIVVSEAIDFIQRGGIIQLVTSSELSEQDVKTIEKSVNEKEKILSEKFLEELKQNTDELITKCSSIFGWMLANKVNGKPQLEIKIAIPTNSEGIDLRSIYHPKVGIMTLKDDSVIAFSGSVNETGKAWKDNIEEFKVFKSWGDTTHKKAIEVDKNKFKKFWEDRANNTKVYELPEAVKEHLIKIRPKSTEEFHQIISEIKEDIKQQKIRRIKLYRYQEDAVEEWKKNGHRGLLEMATGTGKTFTAFGCINEVQSIKKRLVVIIASPQKHLVEQWIENIRLWNNEAKENLKINDSPFVISFSDNPKWKNDLEKQIRNFNTKLFSGDYISNGFIVHTTHNTLSSPDFISKIENINGEIMLIVDEVHAIGSENMQRALIEKYDFRLGLSATPMRHFDDEGSAIIRNYFGGVVYELDIETSIERGFLVPYDYLPYYAELNDDEMTEYRILTQRIASKYGMAGGDREQEGEFTSFAENERANLVATAEGKYDILREILDSKNNKLQDALIYCHDRQLTQVTQILTNRNIVSDSITWEDPTADRLKIINNLSNHHFDCLTAIRCLDEGVDIPSATTAIIMASTGNPRQYIQRRGRVLRRNEITNKQKAIIYDILVKPPISDDQNISRMERKLVARELLRHKEFATIARNRDEAIEKIRTVAQTYNIDFDLLSSEYINEF